MEELAALARGFSWVEELARPGSMWMVEAEMGAPVAEGLDCEQKWGGGTFERMRAMSESEREGEREK